MQVEYEEAKLAACRTYGIESEKLVGRGQILRDLQRQYRDIDQKACEIWTVQAILQPMIHKSDRLLDWRMMQKSGQCLILTVFKYSFIIPGMSKHGAMCGKALAIWRLNFIGGGKNV